MLSSAESCVFKLTDLQLPSFVHLLCNSAWPQSSTVSATHRYVRTSTIVIQHDNRADSFDENTTEDAPLTIELTLYRSGRSQPHHCQPRHPRSSPYRSRPRTVPQTMRCLPIPRQYRADHCLASASHNLYRAGGLPTGLRRPPRCQADCLAGRAGDFGCALRHRE